MMGQDAYVSDSGLLRTIVKMPRPRYPGGTEFYGTIPKRNATFGWSELCATPVPECSLAPSREIPNKSWYNTYLYVPEENSHIERQYLERFVPGPNGEWIDAVKAQRMSRFLTDKQEKAASERRLVEAIRGREGVDRTDYTDAYTGERLVAFEKELLPVSELLQRHHMRDNGWKESIGEQGSGPDFDNLRIPQWPFGRPNRNKMIDNHVYDWFDRRNQLIHSDRSYDILETSGAYVDQDIYQSSWFGAGREAEMMVPLAEYNNMLSSRERMWSPGEWGSGTCDQRAGRYDPAPSNSGPSFTDSYYRNAYGQYSP